MELERIQELLSALIYPYGGLRAPAETLAANRKGQQGLWAFGISGDYPILLVRIGGEDDLDLVQQAAARPTPTGATRQLKIDLVILNAKEASYSQELRNQLHRLLVRLHSETWVNQRGGIFILYTGQMGDADRVLLESAARAVLDARRPAHWASNWPPPAASPTTCPPFMPERTPGAEAPVPALERPGWAALRQRLRRL